MNVPTVESQVLAARSRALVVPAAALAVLTVTGSDRQSWLNGLVTCDLAKLAVGDAAYGLAVAQKGRILADLTFLIEEGRVLVVAPKSETVALRLAFDHYLIMEDAEMAQDEDSFAVFFVHGPNSAAVLETARKENAWGGLVDRTGLGGAVVVAPRAIEAALREKLQESAAIGDDAGWEALRLERAVPRFGVDFDSTMYPQEASLEKAAVSFAKGCYLGQEVVCMLEMRGHVKRKLVSLVVSGADVPAKGAAVTDAAGEKVGEVTSAAPSPTLNAPVALAMVKYAHATLGATLKIGGADAKVVERAR